MNTIAEDIREYTDGIEGLDKRIVERKREASRLDPNSTTWVEANKRIYDMECMRDDMVGARRELSEYLETVGRSECNGEIEIKGTNNI